MAELPPTEDVPRRFETAESWPTGELLEALLERQSAALAAVGTALPALARAVSEAVPRIRAGGRLVYCGAGTSGRIAVQDAVELWPTYSFPRERVAFVLAGGEAALTRALEGAEDDAEAARAAVRDLAPGGRDVVLAVAASGRTPFVLAAVREAKAAGALTVGIANDPDAPLLAAADIAVALPTGAEFPAGSTRMVAGTAQKIALNLFSTALMVRLGRVHRGRMVALQATNAKLRARAVRLLHELCGVGEERARALLDEASGDLRLALWLASGADMATARARLAAGELPVHGLAQAGIEGEHP